MEDLNAGSSKQRTVSKFSGEAFDVGNVRTVFAGASTDDMERSDRVILLVGGSGSNKSILIDCMCNYFYGAQFEGDRYKIANEIFDQGSTPMKSITKYVFNATVMPFRPVVIDTPEIVNDSEVATKEATVSILHNFQTESQNMQINALCLVLKFDEETINKDENTLMEIINLFPRHLLPNTIILFLSNNEKPSLSQTIKLALRHLNLSYNKYYFFNDHCLQLKKENEKEDEIEEKVELSWKLSMNELDRFFRQVRLLDPLSIVPDENTEFSDNSMPEYTSTSTQSSIKNIPHERIIPIKLVGEQSTNFESLNYNSSQLPLTKPYLFDPKRTTHHEYLTNLRKDGRLSDGEYANIQNFDTMISRTKPHETLINDIPRENEIVKKQSLPSNENENGAGYLHMRRTPPPEYSTETRALSRHSSDDEGRGTAKIKKRMSPLLDIESQQKALHSRSAVQRQIARRTSSGSEHSKIYGAPSQQQHLAKNRQVKQTEQVIKKLEDAIQDESSRPLNIEERGSYIATPKLKRTKSPILMRLLMSKMKRRYPTSSTSTNARDQLDNDFEQPRGAVEANIDQSSLRNFGRVVHEDELEERLQDTTIQLSRDSANSATVSPKNFRTEKGGIGMNYEHDQLLDATKKQLNFEEGLTPHPYKTEPWIISGRKHKVGDDEVHVMESGKTSTSCATWNWINCCFYLLAPLFIFFVIVTVVITLALLA